MHAWTEWAGRFWRIAPYNIVAVKLARATLSESMSITISRAVWVGLNLEFLPSIWSALSWPATAPARAVGPRRSVGIVG